ncbi:hypothetical protein FP73_gp010 [Bacillus phage Hoody T]|uniref:Uncharacterized protein n=1 Tax=Bacillus phage Hoody T TaxID=1486660 RepID=A0A024B1S0_9CAUD|nr:hypothetical protein FP73_gp010 [Bacillus phage Hoody T]AHZ10322.1 hypothetical protein [Bacillus phage Hoody T]
MKELPVYVTDRDLPEWSDTFNYIDMYGVVTIVEKYYNRELVKFVMYDDFCALEIRKRRK